jgi:hypothetical protein
MNKLSFISIASARLLFVAPFSAINWQQSALFYTSFCTGALFLFLQDHSPAMQASQTQTKKDRRTHTTLKTGIDIAKKEIELETLMSCG